MIESGQKTSLLIQSQLPEFVRDNPDYEKFVLFLQTYYEWLEENNNVTDRTKNILNYKDIDKTSAEFLDYFYNDFLPYFPKEILGDKVKTTKLAKQLYQSKGTQSAYKFLFRVLYDSDVEFLYTKDAVLKASAGKWYVAKSLKLDSSDVNFLKATNYRIFGETTKSIATIENSVIVGNKVEVFISNIERLFQSGEIVRVVDANNQDVLFDNQPLKGKLLGQISQIKIDPKNRGLLYQRDDPIVVYGGLNSNIGIGASASVGDTTKGSIQRIKVETGGYGYRSTPNTAIEFQNASGASAIIGSLDPSLNSIGHVSFLDSDVIGLKHMIALNSSNYNFSNIVTSNIDTTLVNAFSFISFDTYPISSVLVTNGGGGITQIPSIEAWSLYETEIISDWSNIVSYNVDEVINYDNRKYMSIIDSNLGHVPIINNNLNSNYWSKADSTLKSMGMLAPIQISTAGLGYEVNDTIVFDGGSGYGAYANISSVLANGAINTVSYIFGTQSYPLGGMGYRLTQLPTLSVNSANVDAYGANLYVPGILGDGATFTPSTDRVGSISTINIINPGEDYISAPQISLKVQDIVVKGLVITNLPQTGDVVYQGTDFANSIYKSYVDSISLLSAYADPLESLYILRVYNYNAAPNIILPLKIDSSSIEMAISVDYGGKYGLNGYINYGDGTAKANASFLNGLVVSQGQYLDSTGQPSSFDVLQNTDYNNYTYKLTLEKEIAKYRETLLSLLHPSGMKVLGRYALKSHNNVDYKAYPTFKSGKTLTRYTGDPSSHAEMTATFDNPSTNIIQLYNLNGFDITTLFYPGNTITLQTSSIDGVYAEIVDVVGYGSNTITIADDVWLTFYNVATATANSGDNFINITLSNPQPYDLINNRNYSNTDYPLKDIIRYNDIILVANNTQKTVDYVDYDHNVVYLLDTLTDDVNSLLSVNRTISTQDVIVSSSVN